MEENLYEQRGSEMQFVPAPEYRKRKEIVQ